MGNADRDTDYKIGVLQLMVIVYDKTPLKQQRNYF